MSIVINFCPTGMVPTKAMNYSIPISPNEIIEQTHQAYEIGITIAHLHARLADETPTYKQSVYQKIFEGVRKYCPELIICGSSSGRNTPEFEKRSEVIELRPDMCSLTLSSLNFMNQSSLNEPEMISNLLDKMIEYGVKPELECFDNGMINFGKYLLKKKNITTPSYWNLLFGNIAGFQPTFNQIGTAISEIPKHDLVSLGGLGSSQLKVNSLAISMNLGVRVGLEDNLWFDQNKKVPATNISLLKRIHDLLEINQKTYLEPKTLGNLGFYNKSNHLIGV